MAQRQSSKEKRPGPRPRGPYAEKRRTFTTRITEENRKRLEAAARNSDRSLSQEAELRLERSFLKDREIESVFGDRTTYRLMVILATAKKLIEEQADKSGLDADEIRSEILACWNRLLRDLVVSPSQPLAEEDLLPADAGRTFGVRTADWFLDLADNKSDEET